MKRIIIIVGLVALLGGGGAAAYFLLFAAPPEAAEPAPEPPPEPDAPDYVKMDTLAAPLVDARGKVVRYVFLKVSLEIGDAEKLAQIEAGKPRLHDAFLRALSRGSLSLPGQPGSVDLEAVKARLMARAAQELGAGVVTRVLVTSAQESGG